MTVLLRRAISIGSVIVLFASAGWLVSGIVQSFQAAVLSTVARPCENDTCGWHRVGDPTDPNDPGFLYYGCGDVGDSRSMCDELEDSGCKSRKCRWWEW